MTDSKIVMGAIQSHNLDLLKSIVYPESIRAEDQDRLDSILFELAMSGTTSSACLDYFLKYVDINKYNSQHRTALHLASFFGHATVAEALLKQNHIIIDRKTRAGCTALYFASCRGFKPIVMSLIGAGADTNTANDSGSTPLIAASYNNHIDTVKYLLQHKADPNHRDDSGMTAMHAAALNGCSEVFSVLERHGGDPLMADSAKRTPIEILQSKIIPNRTSTSIQMITNINSNRAYESTEDTTAAGSNSTGCMNQIAKKITKQHAQDENSHTEDQTFVKTKDTWKCADLKAFLFQGNTANHGVHQLTTLEYRSRKK